jgi:Protein of unknown function (DUF1573)
LIDTDVLARVGSGYHHAEACVWNTSNQQPATSNQQPATSNQQPATSNQQPATSNQQPATSNQQPAILISMLLLGISGISYSLLFWNNRTTSFNSASPCLTFETQSYNFGNVSQFEMLTASIGICNTSKHTVRIKQLVKSCGCTEATIDKMSLSPAETAKVTITWSTGTKEGDVKLPTMIHYAVENDTHAPDRWSTVNVYGNVQPNVKLSQKKLIFTPTCSMHMLTVQPRTETGVAITKIVSSAPSFEVSPIHGQSDSYRVRYLKNDFRSGDTEYLSIQTNMAPVTWTVVQLVAIGQ